MHLNYNAFIVAFLLEFKLKTAFDIHLANFHTEGQVSTPTFHKCPMIHIFSLGIVGEVMFLILYRSMKK
jgi:hypothetical protein